MGLESSVKMCGCMIDGSASGCGSTWSSLAAIVGIAVAVGIDADLDHGTVKALVVRELLSRALTK